MDNRMLTESEKQALLRKEQEIDEALHVIQPRTCGSCTMCCKIMGVEELGKPPHEWCRHTDVGYGCRIYPDRPPTCKEFECLWLQQTIFPEELRPDKCRVVLSSLRDGDGLVAFEDVGYFGAAQKGRMGRVLEKAGRAGVPVIIVRGDDRVILYSGSKTNPKLVEMINRINQHGDGPGDQA